jgi:hypothetical protein
MNTVLPTGFGVLGPFVIQWAIDGTAARAALRGESSADERSDFYAALLPLAAQALDYLDARPWGQYDAAENRLMAMLLSFAHVSIAVEIQKEDEAKHKVARSFMPITHAPADQDFA